MKLSGATRAAAEIEGERATSALMWADAIETAERRREESMAERLRAHASRCEAYYKHALEALRAGDLRGAHASLTAAADVEYRAGGDSSCAGRAMGALTRVRSSR